MRYSADIPHMSEISISNCSVDMDEFKTMFSFLHFNIYSNFLRIIVGFKDIKWTSIWRKIQIHIVRLKLYIAPIPKNHSEKPLPLNEKLTIHSVEPHSTVQ